MKANMPLEESLATCDKVKECHAHSFKFGISVWEHIFIVKMLTLNLLYCLQVMTETWLFCLIF